MPPKKGVAAMPPFDHPKFYQDITPCISEKTGYNNDANANYLHLKK